MAIPMKNICLSRPDQWDINAQTSSYRRQEAVLDQSAPSQAESALLLGNYEHKSSNTRIENKAVENHIYWRYPTLMVLTLLSGLLLAIGHHFFYRWLDGQIAGSAAEQQWSLRIGNSFAIFVSYLLKLAVGISYTQYLWRMLQNQSISFTTINDVFSVQNNLLSFFNLEFLSKMRIALILTVILWLLPLTTVFAPATLSITNSQLSTLSHISVPNIGISNSSLASNFVSYERLGDAPTQVSSQLARIVGAVAMSGHPETLQPPAPQPNISYTLQAYAPLLRCGSGNATVQSLLATTLMNVSSGYNGTFTTFGPLQLTPQNFNNQTLQWNQTLKYGLFYGDIGYFSVVPVVPYSQDVFQSGSNISLVPWWQYSESDDLFYNLGGQIWIAISASTSNTTHETQMEFINCQFCNASLTINVDFINHVSNITVLDKQWINDLYISNFSDNNIFGANYAISSIFSYFAFFREISLNLVGYVSWWQDGSMGSRLEQDTQMLNTYLGTSYQAYGMLQAMKTAVNTTGEIYPTNQLRNISFVKDVEEFALSAVLSLLSDSALCNMVNTTINTTTTETVYLYKSKNLIIVYTCVWTASAISVLIGAFALHLNGVAYDTKISTIAITMQTPDIREILGHHSTTTQSLDKNLGKLKLRFVGSKGFVKGDSS